MFWGASTKMPCALPMERMVKDSQIWVKVKPIKEAVYRCTAVNIGNRIYVLAGLGSKGKSSIATQVYDIFTRRHLAGESCNARNMRLRIGGCVESTDLRSGWQEEMLHEV